MCRCLPRWSIIRRLGQIMKIKFTLIDYLIIILVICAIAFAFIHIATDDSSDLKKTAFDESTVNKIPDTYSKYYKDGYIVKTTVDGYNSTDGSRITLNGTVVWEDDNGGNGIKMLVESDNQTYMVGLYRTLPSADIYIDHISLDVDDIEAAWDAVKAAGYTPIETEIDGLPYFEKGVRFFNIAGPNAETVEFCQIL